MPAQAELPWLLMARLHPAVHPRGQLHDFAFGTQIKTLSALSQIAGVAPLGLVGVRCAATSRPHIRASAPSHARQSSPSR